MKFKINILKFLLGIALAIPLLAYNSTLAPREGKHASFSKKDVNNTDEDGHQTIVTSLEAVIPFVQINLHQDIIFDFFKPVFTLQSTIEEKVDLPVYINKYFRVLLKIIITPQAP